MKTFLPYSILIAYIIFCLIISFFISDTLAWWKINAIIVPFILLISYTFKKDYFPYLLLTIYIILCVGLAFYVYDRATWWAENIPVMIVIIGLIATFKVFRFSNTAYFLMWFFLCYHTIGGHYSFALVPFDIGNQLLGMLNMDFLFPELRNNFDRVGHFMVGFFAYPIAELCYRKKWTNTIWASIFMGIFALGFWGALYEVIETIYAVSAGGEAGADFLGSQGDIWDAQKDMLLDILGASLVSILFYFKSKKSLN